MQFIKNTGLTGLDDYLKDGLIEPVGYALNRNRVVAPYFHPRQHKELLRNLGINLFQTKQYISENDAKSMTGLDIRHARIKGAISPKGYGLEKTQRGNLVSPFYSKSALKRYKDFRGITLDNTKGLLSEKEVARIIGADQQQISKRRRAGAIVPVGTFPRNASISYFYKKSQIAQIKRLLPAKK